MEHLKQETVDQIVGTSVAQRLSSGARPPITDDHAAHIIQLTRWGQTGLAADHLLFPEINGSLAGTVSGLIRGLNILFASSKPAERDPKTVLTERLYLRQVAYETLLETALNFYGLESRWLKDAEKSEALSYIRNALDEWEATEREESGFTVARAVLNKWLAKMKRVQKGVSMAARAAARIEEGLDFEKKVLNTFLEKAEKEITGNIYYRMVKEERCKFGNDYALGLRWLRHLGFEQVSTNPVLAARAYQDEPSLYQTFKDEFKGTPIIKSGLPLFPSMEMRLPSLRPFLPCGTTFTSFGPSFSTFERPRAGASSAFSSIRISPISSKRAFETCSRRSPLLPRTLPPMTSTFWQATGSMRTGEDPTW